ncbi:MAG: histidine phosphatase family protein [Chloroflexi bacterium]|nr:histidine phosphatase family protein [Chloroflexota bacterium]
MGIKRILLIRHGQTDWNMEGRWQGSLPVPLNDIGRAQARALAAHLRESPIRAIYSSDLPRALETAQLLGAALGVQPTPDVRLREFDLGIFQGLKRDEMMARYPAEWASFNADYWDYSIPGGESRRALQRRMWEAWQDVVARDEGPEVAIVSHGGALRLLLLKLFGESPEVSALRLENTSVTAVERNGAGWKLVGAADISHLASLSEDLESGPVNSPPEHQNI